MPIQFSLIVTNCRLVGQSSTELSDIGVQQGRVHCIVPGGSLKNAHADRIIDAKAAYVTVVQLNS
jgi:dihydroorotase-like cyclic amidohydrolase